MHPPKYTPPNVLFAVCSFTLPTLTRYSPGLFVRHLWAPPRTMAGVPIAHETHRQRLLFSPYSCRDVLKSPGMEALKITADLSHWCCVCEHVFDPSDPRDDWWPEVLALVAKHTTLIHARVGYDEGPQVSDPSAPEYKGQVASHMAWWKAIWASQKARGFTEFFAEPEFGPAPYQQMLPHTAVPTTDLWAVNGHVADLLKAEFPY